MVLLEKLKITLIKEFKLGGINNLVQILYPNQILED